MELIVQDTLHNRQISIKDGKKGRLIADLVRSEEFERLKNIKQISYSSEAFPQARHTRYIHSLGVFYLADQMLRNIKDQHPQTYDPHQAMVVRVRAILHDIGHGPRSHSWEGVMGALGHTRSHEEWGHYIVSGDTEVGDILRDYDQALYDDVCASFLRKEPESFWDTIIASQFDADRLDYLQRDAQNSGISVGINEGYLLGNLKLAYVGGDTDDVVLAFDPKAELSVLQFLQSRAMLYSSLSHNKHSESSDALMQHVFVEAQRLFRECGPENLGFNPDDAHIKIIMAEPDDVDVKDYLYADDAVLTAFIKKLAASDDPRLEGLSRKANLLKKSKPLAVVDFVKLLPNKSQEAVSRALEVFEEISANDADIFSGYFFKRKASYKKTENPFDKIWIANGGDPKDISDIATIPDDIVSGCVFSEDQEVINVFKERLQADPVLKQRYGAGYGFPFRAVPAPNMA